MNFISTWRRENGPSNHLGVVTQQALRCSPISKKPLAKDCWRSAVVPLKRPAKCKFGVISYLSSYCGERQPSFSQDPHRQTHSPSRQIRKGCFAHQRSKAPCEHCARDPRLNGKLLQRPLARGI